MTEDDEGVKGYGEEFGKVASGGLSKDYREYPPGHTSRASRASRAKGQGRMGQHHRKLLHTTLPTTRYGYTTLRAVAHAAEAVSHARRTAKPRGGACVPYN